MSDMVLKAYEGQRVSSHMIDQLVAQEIRRIREADESAARAREAAMADRLREQTRKEARMYRSMSISSWRRYALPERTRWQKVCDWLFGWYGLLVLGLWKLVDLAERLGLIEWAGEDEP